MDHRLIEGLMEVVAPIVRDYVEGALAKATGPLIARIAELEGREVTKGEPGEPGKSVTLDDVRPFVTEYINEAVAKIPVPQDGKSVTIEEVRPLVDAAVAALPKPADGKSVTLEEMRPLVAAAVAEIPKPQDGKSVELGDVRLMIAEEVAKIPPASNGKDGKSVTIDDVRPIIEELVAALPVAKDGASGEPGQKGDAGRDGRDASDIPMLKGFIAEEVKSSIETTFKTISLSSEDGGRTLTFGVDINGEPVRHEIKTALVLDRGVWRAGNFAKGDGVTWGGSFLVAQRDTSAKPETSEAKDDWRVAVKRGRDGRDGKNGEKGIQGPPGAPGRDGRQY